MTNQPKQDEAEPGLLEVIISVAAAMFGVQNAKNRERDFKHGNAISFIIVGILFTAFFVGALVLIVSQVVD